MIFHNNSNACSSKDNDKNLFDFHLIMQKMGLYDRVCRLDANLSRKETSDIWEDQWWKMEEMHIKFIFLCT